VFEQRLLKVNSKSGWSVTVSDRGQTALTRYRILGRGQGIAWLELRPQTGRTHQLRVHCAAAGCPIVADRLYGRAESRSFLHLHARTIVLPLSTTRPPIVVEAPPPPHMREALASCGWRPEPTPVSRPT
jgi:23S rRNA-/tRNA-specific pseudouridylate synthase